MPNAQSINPGYTVVTDIDTAGAIIWWRLSGDVDLAGLRQRWIDCGLPEAMLPENPSPTVALSRAAFALGETRRLIRPLPANAGWAVVDEVANVSSATLSYETTATIKLDGSGALVIAAAMAPGLKPAEVAKLQADFAANQLKLTVHDVSAWLSKLVKPMLKAVTLRDTGGVYFVPKDHVETYHQMVKALVGTSSHRLFEVPALKSDEAVDAILDAVLREADGECGAMETELDTGDLKKRALTARQNRCELLREKVEAYEALLGRSMGAVRERIENLKASVVDAALSLAVEEVA